MSERERIVYVVRQGTRDGSYAHARSRGEWHWIDNRRLAYRFHSAENAAYHACHHGGRVVPVRVPAKKKRTMIPAPVVRINCIEYGNGRNGYRVLLNGYELWEFDAISPAKDNAYVVAVALGVKVTQ